MLRLYAFPEYLDKCKVTECTEKNNSEMSHNCEIIASAPPEELSKYISSLIKIYVLP